jgi:hypothetical protein
VESAWVEQEWHTMYWDEIASNQIKLIPVLGEECKIPKLLRHRKYANLTESYNDGLEEILLALGQKPRLSKASKG